MPKPDNRIYLGEFWSCLLAVAEARNHYAKVNGCYFCSNACHTT